MVIKNTVKGNKKLKDWKVLEFFVPITEQSFDEDTNSFMIRGVAINETTTLNNIKYVADELEKASESFRNVPILLDHRNEVMNIVGRTTENVNFNHMDKRIDFEACIMDKGIIERIKDGRIQNVSIGAKVNDLTEEEDGSKKAIGIHGLEISMVAVPGDGGAGLAQAIENNFVLKEKAMCNENCGDCEEEEVEEEIEKKDESIDVKNLKKDIEEIKETIKDLNNSSLEQTEKVNTKKEENMTDENKEKIEDVPQEEEKKEVEQESKDVEVTESTLVIEQRKEIDALKEIISTKKKLQEELKELESKEEIKDETKGEVSEEPEEEKSEETIDMYNVENSSIGKGMSFYGDYSKNPKLNRLSR